MQAQTLTPGQIFGLHIRYVVPLFQRPYVWNEQDQWAPLWVDVRSVAERVLEEAPSAYAESKVAAHFLGAIVLDHAPTATGYISVKHVIDGQQRLTTLQVMLDAAQWVTERHGDSKDAVALHVMVTNEPAMAQHSHEVFKVWPTDRDQEAFRAVMDNDSDVPPDLATNALARAHAFFVREIESWAEVAGDPDKAGARLKALTRTLHKHLMLVVIDLGETDNAQVIFETLNHRGTPLLAADLIKNLIFQIATRQNRDVAALYQKYWKALDSDFWRQKISRGNQFVPRIDIFVNHWLIARLFTEVPADHIFVAFREYLLDTEADIDTVLSELAAAAEIYATLDTWPADSPVGRFRYRIIEALDTAVVTPVLLWLLRWPSSALPPDQRDKALGALESWFVRRALCRLTSKDVSRLTLDLLRTLDAAGPGHAGDEVEKFLITQSTEARLWPDYKHLLVALIEPVYNRLLRARLRMVLEAVEDHTRTSKSEGTLCPRGLTVEHLMPQAWREHWLEEGSDVTDRDTLIHTLGNLTLVNHKLNPALSNRPWTDKQAEARGLGATGKRTEMLKHSTLKINADLVRLDEWNHEEIRRRTTQLLLAIMQIWPKPDSFEDTLMPLSDAEREQPPAAGDPDAPTAAKYLPITQWLAAQGRDSLPVSFDDLEDVLGFSLAPSARNYLAYWYSVDNSLGKAIAAGGYKASGVNLTDERLVLIRRL